MKRLGRACLFLLAASASAEVLYNRSGVLVAATETTDSIEFCVAAPEPVSVSIYVDRNQNAQIDSRVDTKYGLRPDDRRICTQYVLGLGHTTFCGELPSQAQLNMRHERGRREYTYFIPKSELSFGQTSAWVALGIWDAAHRVHHWFPREDLKETIHIPYRVK